MTNRFPPAGRPREEVLDELEAARENDVDWRGGRIGLYTHFGGEDVLEIAKDAARMYFSETPAAQAPFQVSRASRKTSSRGRSDF